jgi:hypothetical protein
MTSLGNTMINAFVVMYATLVSGMHPTRMFKFKFEGDDSVTFVKSVDPDIVGRIIEALSNIGF